jgi:hypothetical protein
MRRAMKRYIEATVRFEKLYNNHDARYIHKYYLPQELKARIFPVDINGIGRCLSNDDWHGVWEGRAPEYVPNCLILYKDIGLEKRIDAETARRVLLAAAAYHADCSAELTAEEEQAAMKLNAWFIEWEKDLLDRCYKLGTEMERQVRSGDSWLTDYEIEVEVDFYVREDDPFHLNNMPDAQNEDIDKDTSLLCTMKDSLCMRNVMRKNEDYWGIGDNQDHSELSGLASEGDGFNHVRECLTYHELFSQYQFPRKHAGRIGYVSTDIVVRHQNGITIDLKGDKAIAVRDEPQVREDIVLCDEVTQKSANS